MATETIEVTGHIVDSLLLAKILDSILEAGCDYEIADVSIGKTSLDPSSARIGRLAIICRLRASVGSSSTNVRVAKISGKLK